MTRANPTRRPHSSEEGYILLWVIFMVAIFTISLSVAVPRIIKEIQLDRERETMMRGKQYTRAVQLYYRKFHAYPPNVDALVKTNEIRFLRKKYIDPMTGKDDWKPIRFGQSKDPDAGLLRPAYRRRWLRRSLVLAGIGPSGGNGLNGGSAFGGPGSSIGGSSLFGSSPPGTGPGSTNSHSRQSHGFHSRRHRQHRLPPALRHRHVGLRYRPHRADLRRRRHHRLLAASTQAIPS